MVACAGFLVLGSTLYVTSLTLTSTANVPCIGAMAPLFVAAASRLVLGERPASATWFAALLALFGVTLIFQDGLVRGSWLGASWRPTR
jgi:drug/metabolite transporter (DMT)-like permease